MAISVVLDACVLYPVGLRDTLLDLARRSRLLPGALDRGDPG